MTRWTANGDLDGQERRCLHMRGVDAMEGFELDKVEQKNVNW